MSVTRRRRPRYPWLNAEEARESLVRQRFRARWVGLYLVVGVPIIAIGFLADTPPALAALLLVFVVGTGAITLWARLGVPLPAPDADVEEYRRLARAVITREGWTGIGLCVVGAACWLVAVKTVAWEHTSGIDQFEMVLFTVLIPAFAWVSVRGVRDPDGVARGHLWTRPRVTNRL